MNKLNLIKGWICGRRGGHCPAEPSYRAQVDSVSQQVLARGFLCRRCGAEIWVPAGQEWVVSGRWEGGEILFSSHGSEEAAEEQAAKLGETESKMTFYVERRKFGIY